MATPTHSTLGELLFATIGVGAFAVVASVNEKAGKILLFLMLGFFIIFFVSHGTTFSSAMQKLNNLGAQKG